jgi:hypothetical protein
MYDYGYDVRTSSLGRWQDGDEGTAYVHDEDALCLYC